MTKLTKSPQTPKITKTLKPAKSAVKAKAKARPQPARSKFETILSLLSYLIVPIFFIVLYLTMTMNYEDIYQRAANLDDNVGTIWYEIYHYIPRIGELYQRTAVHFMTPQLSFGTDLLFRLLAAAIASSLFYLLTMFVLGRRPRLRFGDALIQLGLFICLLLLGVGEIFTFNFSFTHNYVIAALLLVAFALPYRLQASSRHPAALAGMFVLGILIGLSSEIIPVALLLILLGLSVYQLKVGQFEPGQRLRQFWQKYRLQIIGVFGLLVGLVIFYLGAGLDARVNGGYSAVYDYVSPFGIFSAPVYTVCKLVSHLFYNIRHLHFAIILMFLILLLEYAHYRHHQANHLVLQTACLAFCILYVGAVSLLSVHDDLYPRFMSPVYLTVFASTWLYASDYLLSPQVFTARMLRNFYLVAVAAGVLMVVDLGYAMVRYHFTAQPYLQEIVVDENLLPAFDSALTAGEQDMRHSPIFQFRQSSPFHWPVSCNCASN